MDETTVRIRQAMVVRIELAEGLVVGPDEILIVKIPVRPTVDGGGIVRTDAWGPATMKHLYEALRARFGKRFLIIKGDVELSKAAR